MRLRLSIALVLLLAATSASATEFVLGPYFGQTIPVANEEAEAGGLWGVQGRAYPLSFIGIGARYTGASYGSIENTFFQGTPNETTFELDGGDVTMFTGDLYLGRNDMLPGINVFLMGSAGVFKWKRTNREDVSEFMWSAGLVLEVVIPYNIGIEGRALFDAVPKADEGSYKAFSYSLGINYHFDFET